MDPFGPLNNAVAAVDRLRAVGKAIEHADYREAIADLKLSLADAKEQMAKMQNELIDLRKVSELKVKVVPHSNAYWLPDDGQFDGPFSTRAFDTDGTLLRMRMKSSNQFGVWFVGIDDKETIAVQLDWLYQNNSRLFEEANQIANRPKRQIVRGSWK